MHLKKNLSDKKYWYNIRYPVRPEPSFSVKSKFDFFWCPVSNIFFVIYHFPGTQESGDPARRRSGGNGTDFLPGTLVALIVVKESVLWSRSILARLRLQLVKTQDGGSSSSSIALCL